MPTIKMFGGELSFDFDTQDLEAWVNRKNRFRNRAKNLRTPFRQFGDYMIGSIDRNFKAEGRPESWQPLAPKTVRDRIRLGYGAGPILQRTDKLRRSFYYVANNRKLTIDSFSPYKNYHQLGTNRIPKRVMMIMQNRDKAEFTNIISRWLTS